MYGAGYYGYDFDDAAVIKTTFCTRCLSSKKECECHPLEKEATLPTVSQTKTTKQEPASRAKTVAYDNIGYTEFKNIDEIYVDDVVYYRDFGGSYLASKIVNISNSKLITLYVINKPQSYRVVSLSQLRRIVL